jgi:hypothetical protein
MDFALTAAVLIVLHNLDGDEIIVNPEYITVLKPTHDTKGTSNTLVARGGKCVVGIGSGKFITVIEDCSTIRQAMQQEEKRPGWKFTP